MKGACREEEVAPIDIPDMIPFLDASLILTERQASSERGEGKHGHILCGPQEINSDPDPLLLQLNNIQTVWNTDCCKQCLQLQVIKSNSSSLYQQG